MHTEQSGPGRSFVSSPRNRWLAGARLAALVLVWAPKTAHLGLEWHGAGHGWCGHAAFALTPHVALLAGVTLIEIWELLTHRAARPSAGRSLRGRMLLAAWILFVAGEIVCKWLHLAVAWAGALGVPCHALAAWLQPLFGPQVHVVLLAMVSLLSLVSIVRSFRHLGRARHGEA